ncbi:hypothetical protein ABFS82_10G078700 [Erythranthe guttata]|uniref:Uncharacterized protein n=1 Tax=Erythranthe guttata TaxID=4155 RepID=A0A022QEW1_ERYGU|nr:PREDICTED: uncharacterized protein LOC105970865 [Erythranthe guttata]EYU25818.1 hypothetical protein MIMGU_mgv1a020072mg [Erythranthe guttata]|eukprot:XP_012851143.1 PREDICTED: uncharacterized protein LOC105970865 [Erythranthe guttata]
MGTLDSPLEALALNYLTYGFLTVVNSIWPWVAVITAAVSFWRIRALSSPELRNAASCKAEAEEEEEEEAIVSDAPARAFCCRVLARECSTKTKFRLYYEEEDFRGDDGGESDDYRSEVAAAEAAVSEKLDYCPRRRCDDWERTMVVMRMGDLGWYRWQDMTVLDGSVVRLWEGRRR